MYFSIEEEDSRSVLNVYWHIWAHPRYFTLTMHGREFVNNLICATSEIWGGDVTFVSGRPCHSQSQGLVERGNHNVEQKIAAMKQDKGHGVNKYPWVSWLSRIMFSMNFERHEGKRTCPIVLHLVDTFQLVSFPELKNIV